jgi:hypothetical protein
MEDLHAESFGMAVRIVRSRRKSVDDGRRSVRQWTTTKLKGATQSLLPIATKLMCVTRRPRIDSPMQI